MKSLMVMSKLLGWIGVLAIASLSELSSSSAYASEVLEEGTVVDELSALGEGELEPLSASTEGDFSPLVEPTSVDLPSSEATEATSSSEAERLSQVSGEESIPAEISEASLTSESTADSETTQSEVEVVSDIAEATSASDQTELFFELVPVDSAAVPADNRSTLDLQGTITDSDGNPLLRDIVVTLTTTAGEFLGADYDSDLPGFQALARQGQFQVSLRSTLEAQQVQVRAVADGYEARGLERETTLDPVADLTAVAQLVFITHLRPSLVSGVIDFRLGAGGTDYWGSYQEFLDPNLIGTTDFDLDAGIFATGTFGEWLFTGAINTERALNQTCEGNRLFRDTQFCEQRYPVYGDSSQVDYLTPSIDHVYFRFQRDSRIPGAEPDYFMWGDYNTQEFARASQDFTAITRQLHGFKGNYTFGNVQLTAMSANNLRPFQRDTLAPDGTSGYYFLSRRVILPGSEDIFIEVEELNRPGTVLERRRLFRGADYEIDYDRGTLLFREPIYATQLEGTGPTLVNRIVATYQVDGVGVGGNLYAVRFQYNIEPGEEAAGWAGFTGLWEEQGIQTFQLAGLDVLLPLGETGQLSAEIARSSLELSGQTTSGSAYRLEADGTLIDQILDGSFYFRSASSGFNNTATTSFRPGQTRWGGSLDASLSEQTQLTFRFDQEINVGTAPQVFAGNTLQELQASGNLESVLIPGQYATPGSAVDNTLTTLRLGVRQQVGRANVGLDFINRERDDRIAGTNTSAQQFVPSIGIPLGANLDFNAQSELNFGSESDPLYPTRTTLSLDWRVDPNLTVQLAQQFASGGQQPGSITSLSTIANYDLGDNTTLTSRYSIIGGYNGIIGQSALGLNHRLVLAPGLRANIGFERINSSSFGETGAGQQSAVPYAVGTGASLLGLQEATAYSLGFEYTANPNFQASTRLEHRDSPSGSNTVFSITAAGQITPALTTLFRYQRANYANQIINGNLGSSATAKLGLAYRNPENDRFNGLLSYEYRRNPATTPTTVLINSEAGSGLSSTDHTFAFEGIYSPNWQWEFYTKYAFRINDAIIADGSSYSTSIHLGQLRASYRFAYRWDILGEIRLITQPSASYTEVGTALELGYYLTPDLRVGVGYSFGSVNSDGFGGSGYRSASGPYLGVQFKVNELLDGFGLQTVAPDQQQESYLEPPAATLPNSGEPESLPQDAGRGEPSLDGVDAPINSSDPTLTAPLPDISEEGE
ncbi:MAG: Ig-like domain-containing protein [Leptolyngbyaceae cyanobacterium]